MVKFQRNSESVLLLNAEYHYADPRFVLLLREEHVYMNVGASKNAHTRRTDC